MSKLCNANKDANIKFSVHNAMTGVELNQIKTTVNELAGGKTSHNAANGATLSVDAFNLF